MNSMLLTCPVAVEHPWEEAEVYHLWMLRNGTVPGFHQESNGRLPIKWRLAGGGKSRHSRETLTSGASAEGHVYVDLER